MQQQIVNQSHPRLTTAVFPLLRTAVRLSEATVFKRKTVVFLLARVEPSRSRFKNLLDGSPLGSLRHDPGLFRGKGFIR